MSKKDKNYEKILFIATHELLRIVDKLNKEPFLMDTSDFGELEFTKEEVERACGITYSEFRKTQEE